MQPTTPFKTNSWTVITVELLAWALLITFFYLQRWSALWTSIQISIVLVWLGYLFMRICSLYPWHPNCKSDEGLSRHFQQVAVAACYGFFIANLCATLNIFTHLIIIIAVILVGVSAINATLIGLSRKDTDTTPINYYSHHKIQ